MKFSPFLGMVVCLIAAAVAYLGPSIEMPNWFPAVVHDRPAGPDLRPAFAATGDKTQADQDFRKFGYMCKKMAATIRTDGGQEKPALASGTMLHNLRVLDRKSLFDGRELRSVYPDLNDVVRDYMNEKVGKANSKLTAEDRETWAKAYEAIGSNAIFAADSHGWGL